MKRVGGGPGDGPTLSVALHLPRHEKLEISQKRFTLLLSFLCLCFVFKSQQGRKSFFFSNRNRKLKYQKKIKVNSMLFFFLINLLMDTN